MLTSIHIFYICLMIVKFRKFLQENDLFNPSDTILLSVSGGIDSMVMTHLFHRTGFSIAIAHCNFTLRGRDSAEDEQFVEEYAKSKQIRFHSTRFQTKQHARSHNISVQMAARKLRREWCEQLLQEHDYSYYATAHHLNDQTETFFINLFRGTGIAGIHGILPKKGKLIHPMMFTWKKDIIRYARVNRVPYRLDKSNLKTDYERNTIRHKVIPVLKEINPDFEVIMSQNIQHFRNAEYIYRQQIEKVSREIVEDLNSKKRIQISKLEQLKMARTYLYEILIEFDFNIAVINDIFRTLSAESGKMFHSPTHRLIIDRGFLLIEKTENSTNEKKAYEINDIESDIKEPLPLSLTQVSKSAIDSIPEDPAVAMIDMDLLTFPLILRKWEKGDFFYPLGMNNRKLLSDFFIDSKFSIFQKENTWLLTSQGAIIWVIGHRIDNRFKITEKTRSILRIDLLESS